jgi:glycosyltransferase involved in cell wall biosynthesis
LAASRPANAISMSVKVLFITNYDKPGIHNTRPEAEMILGVKRAGLDVEVMMPRHCYWGDRLAEAGIPIHDFLPRSKLSLDAVRRIRRVLRQGRHDIVHLFNNPAILNGVVASIGLPVRVVTYRGQSGNVSRWNPVQYLMHLSPRVDRIVCVAEAVRDSLRNVVFDPAKLITIYKGHDLAWYRQPERIDLSTLGVPAGAFVVCCVANYRPRKGVDVIIEAMRFLPADAPIHLLLVGTGMDGTEVAQLIAASPQANRIHAVGHRTDVMSIVAASQATVLPAVRREGLPKTVIESMVLEVTPIVTRSGGSPELVEDGVCGLVVPPGDAQALAQAVLRLFRDPDGNRRMGVAARRRIGERFRLEDSVRAHVALYRALAEGGQPQ